MSGRLFRGHRNPDRYGVTGTSGTTAEALARCSVLLAELQSLNSAGLLTTHDLREALTEARLLRDKVDAVDQMGGRLVRTIRAWLDDVQLAEIRRGSGDAATLQAHRAIARAREPGKKGGGDA